jgi:hypothetical protein
MGHDNPSIQQIIIVVLIEATDWLGQHVSAVWKTGSNAKFRRVHKLSACYCDHRPAAYEVDHMGSLNVGFLGKKRKCLASAETANIDPS